VPVFFSDSAPKAGAERAAQAVVDALNDWNASNDPPPHDVSGFQSIEGKKTQVGHIPFGVGPDKAWTVRGPDGGQPEWIYKLGPFGSQKTQWLTFKAQDTTPPDVDPGL